MCIGFYTREPLRLPHAAYPKAVLRVIEQAMSEAWRIIRDHPEGDFDIEIADEDRITRDLCTCLMNTVLDSGMVPAFTSDIFHVVSRDGKFVSYDGSHLDKMPDLHITIKRDAVVSLRSDDGLFIECKPIGPDHPAGSAYCDRGIIRFVNGEYAWALPDGMMIGYAFKGYALPGRLKAAMESRAGVLKIKGDLLACPDAPASGYAQHVHISVHQRGFTYPRTLTVAPDITIRHLWLWRN